jgi:hypothetical protein
MSWEQEIVRDDVAMPPRIVVYGPGGCGKTTFAATMPVPLIIDLDRGAGEIKSTTLLPPNNVRFTGSKHPGRTTWQGSLGLLREIATAPGGIRSLIIDTADVLEDQAEIEVCSDLSCKTIGEPKWGVGYDALEAKWRLMLAELDQIRAKGIIICLLAHTAVKTTHDPTVGEYEEYVSQLGKKTWAATYRWADFVGFANFDLGRLEKENRAIVTGNRMLGTQRGSGFQAKNRYRLEPKIPFAWSALISGIQAFQVGQPVQQASPSATPATPAPSPAPIENAADIILRIEALCKAADVRGLKTSDGKTFFEKGKQHVLDCKLDVAALRALEGVLRQRLEATNGGAQPQASA